MASKWDDVQRKFVQVTSQGLVGYEYGEPLAVAKIKVQSALPVPTAAK